MMIKGMVVDDSMSNLTSASNEASISSGNRDEQSLPAKKKRNLPGNPDPESEVIALSPRTLLATNRFICEVCNKGFQRDQNLQLHRRGHNLPWKLKQRNNKEVIRKKVYVCPEVTCVHHDPSRALGDLTGIKKHFSRKHGEKKWKCEKCSKRYAVQSDWKAHSKICGTREYRCDCGTLFSRRDSFITHRAFCDALAEESARAINPPNPLSYSQPGTSTSHQLNLQNQFHGHALPSAFPLKREQDLPETFNLRPEPGGVPLPSDLSSNFFSPRLEESIMQHQNSNPNPMLISSIQPTALSPHMSATALLQKAAQMGVTMSKPSQSKTMLRPHQVHMITTTGLSSTSLATSVAGSTLGLSTREEMGNGFIHGLASFGNKSVITSGCMEQEGATTGGASEPPSLLHDMITSLPSASHEFEGPSFGGSNFNGILSTKTIRNFQETVLPKPKEGGSRGGNEGLTRDFLGLTAFPNSRDQCLFMADLHQIGSPYEHQSHQN